MPQTVQHYLHSRLNAYTIRHIRITPNTHGDIGIYDSSLTSSNTKVCAISNRHLMQTHVNTIWSSSHQHTSFYYRHSLNLVDARCYLCLFPSPTLLASTPKHTYANTFRHIVLIQHTHTHTHITGFPLQLVCSPTPTHTYPPHVLSAPPSLHCLHTGHTYTSTQSTHTTQSLHRPQNTHMQTPFDT